MRYVLLALLLFGRMAWGACVESPSGTQTCEVFVSSGTGGMIVTGPLDQTGTTNAVQGIVRGVATQTPDLQQWRNASNTPLAGITSAGRVYAAGMNIPRPHGSYYTDATQTVGSTTAAYAVGLVNEVAESGMTHPAPTPTGTPAAVDASKIRIDEAGTYVIEISAIVDMTSAPPSGHLDLWLAVNGSNVTASNTKVEIGSATTEYTLAVPLMYTFAAGDYFQIMYAGDDTDLRLPQATPNPSRTPAIPLTPAVIVSVFKVSGD